MTELRKAPAARAEMLIRRSAGEVFAAVIEPEETTKFWFTRSSGKLEAGRTVRWDWEMYGVSSEVIVKAVEPERRIVFDWQEEEGYSTVEWLFTSRGDNETFVSVENTGFFANAPDDAAQRAIDSTGGFTMVLCAMKAWLEHRIRLNVVADHAPDALVPGWTAR